MLSITSSALPEEARAVAFDGHEMLGRPYRYDVVVTVPDASAVDRADAIGARATLGTAGGDGAGGEVSGIIASASLLHTFREGGVFRIVIVPRLAALAQGRYSRLFTKKSFPDILREVLVDEGITDFELRLSGSYDVEEHVCQYRESHLDFLHRWMEHEGITYYFEQGERGEVVVFTDHASAHRDLLGEPVPYRAGSHAGTTTGGVESFTTRRRSLPQAVSLSDYDYLRPQLDMTARADVAPTGSGEIRHHVSRSFTPAKAKALAKIRAEELLCREEEHLAAGSSSGLRAGYFFEMAGHPLRRLDGRYLVTEHRASGRAAGLGADVRRVAGIEGTDTYRVRATAIDAALQFRPRRVTPWPRVHGFENGVVDGPASSEYAQIDDHGRYLVKLRFDDSSLKHGEASTWVRMLQPHGGNPEGWHFPLRKGTEVLFLFVDGDPDRPVIAGMVPNAHTPSPVTARNHTQNVVQTGGHNRLEIEDLSGTQRMSLSTPTESTLLRLGAPNDDCNARLFSCGVGKISQVGYLNMITHGAKREEDKRCVDEFFKGDFKTTVTLDTTETYNATKLEQVHGDLDQHYLTSQAVTVTGPVTETYQAGHKTTVKGAREETLDSTVSQTYGSQATTVTKAVSDKHQADYQLSVSGHMEHKVSGVYSRKAANIDDQVLLQIENKGMSSKLTVTLNSETYVKKSEITVGAKFEIITFMHIEATAAVLMERVGVKCTLKATEAEAGGAGNDDGEAENESGGAEAENAAVSVEQHTATVEA